MGNEQSFTKAVVSIQKRKDSSVVFRGDLLDQSWIPEDISASIKLECLKLIDMKLYMVPSPLCQLTGLKQLDLSQNGLLSIRGIGALTNITDLDLSKNRLDFLPDEICSLTNLEFLNLSENQLTNRSIPQGFMERSLSSLDISENKFSKITPELLKCLLKSESVSIHSNPWENSELSKVTPETSEVDVKIYLLTIVPQIPNKRQQSFISPVVTSPAITKDSPSSLKVSESVNKDINSLASARPVSNPKISSEFAAINGNSEELTPTLPNSKPPTIKPRHPDASIHESHEKEENTNLKLKVSNETERSYDNGNKVTSRDEGPSIIIPLDSTTSMDATPSDNETFQRKNDILQRNDSVSSSMRDSSPTKDLLKNHKTRPRTDSNAQDPSIEGDSFPIGKHDRADSGGSLGSRFKNFTSKIRGNTVSKNDSPLSPAMEVAPERTAAPLKAFTRIGGPKGRKPPTIAAIVEAPEPPKTKKGFFSSSPKKSSANPEVLSPKSDSQPANITAVEQEDFIASPPPVIPHTSSKPRKTSKQFDAAEDTKAFESLKEKSSDSKKEAAILEIKSPLIAESKTRSGSFGKSMGKLFLKEKESTPNGMAPADLIISPAESPKPQRAALGRTAAAAASVADVISKKLPLGAIHAAELHSAKKPPKEEAEEDLAPVRSHGKKDSSFAPPIGAMKMTLGDLDKNKLKSVTMLNNAGDKSDMKSNHSLELSGNGNSKSALDLSTSNASPTKPLKPPAIAAKPVFELKSDPSSAIPRSENEPELVVPPWKLEMEKRKLAAASNK